MSDINRGGANKVDIGNSTTTPLGVSGVFTGAWVDVLEFAHITIQARASHDSATDGLVIQWSSDGSNIDDTDSFKVTANVGKIFTFGPQARYMRVVYTNGTTSQTSFRLQTILKLFFQKASSHRINSTIMTEDDAELVKAVLSGQDPDGVFKNARVDSAGRLFVTSDIATPADTVPISVEVVGSISGSSDTVYTITNGKTLFLQLFEGGAEQNTTGGSKVVLYDDPNGNLSVLNIISAIYINGSSQQNNLSDQFLGDGTRRIVIRRTVLAGGSREVYSRWKGYEQ